MDKLFHTRFIRFLYVMAISIILICSVYVLFHFVYPFIFAFVLSMFLHPIVSVVEVNWRIHRGLATFFVIASFFCVSLISGYFLLKRLFTELTELTYELPTYIKNASVLLQKFEQFIILPIYDYVGKLIQIKPSDQLLLTQFITEKLKDYTTSFIQQTIISLSNFISSFAYTFLVLFFIILATYFMTKDFIKLQTLWRRYLPAKIKKVSLSVRRFAKQSTLALIKAHISIALLTSVLSFIGLFAFRVEHVLTLTIIIFLIDLIPYLGIGILFIPWMFYEFFSEQYVFTIQLTFLYIVIILVRQVIEPRLLARNLGVHPLITIIILFINIELFGASGFLITPLLLVAISSIYHAKIIHYIIRYIKEGYI